MCKFIHHLLSSLRNFCICMCLDVCLIIIIWSKCISEFEITSLNRWQRCNKCREYKWKTNKHAPSQMTCMAQTTLPTEWKHTGATLRCYLKETREKGLFSWTQKELSLHTAHSECSMCFILTFHFALALSRLLLMNQFYNLCLPTLEGQPPTITRTGSHPKVTASRLSRQDKRRAVI